MKVNDGVVSEVKVERLIGNKKAKRDFLEREQEKSAEDKHLKVLEHLVLATDEIANTMRVNEKKRPVERLKKRNSLFAKGVRKFAKKRNIIFIFNPCSQTFTVFGRNAGPYHQYIQVNFFLSKNR